MLRRTLLAAAMAAYGAAHAQQAWPGERPIRLVVGFPPGGGIDFAARTIQAPLSELLGQQVIIDYKPGASGTLAATELTRAAPDGYTLLLANTGPFAIAPYLMAKRPYDPVNDFTYLGQVSEGSYIAVARPDHPARTLSEFVTWAKAQKGMVSFASGGSGTSTHLNGELLNQVAGLDMTHVPYKGSAPAIQDLIGGQTQLMIDAGTVLLPLIKSGRLKALAVTGSRRDPNLPDVSTVREQGIAGMETVGFQGLVGPARLPTQVVDRLSRALVTVLQRKDITDKFAAAGAEAHALPAREFGAYVKSENDKWQKLIKERRIHAD